MGSDEMKNRVSLVVFPVLFSYTTDSTMQTLRRPAAEEYLLHPLDIHKIVIYNIVYQDKGVKRHGGVQIRVHR